MWPYLVIPGYCIFSPPRQEIFELIKVLMGKVAGEV